MDIATDPLSAIAWTHVHSKELESLVDFVFGADAFEFHEVLVRALNTYYIYHKRSTTYLPSTFRYLY